MMLPYTGFFWQTIDYFSPALCAKVHACMHVRTKSIDSRLFIFCCYRCDARMVKRKVDQSLCSSNNKGERGTEASSFTAAERIAINPMSLLTKCTYFYVLLME
jgi:hypothetical protein